MLNDIQASSVNHRNQVKHPKPDQRHSNKVTHKIKEQEIKAEHEHDQFIIKNVQGAKLIDSKFHNKEIANAAKGIIKKENVNHEI